MTYLVEIETRHIPSGGSAPRVKSSAAYRNDNMSYRVVVANRRAVRPPPTQGPPPPSALRREWKRSLHCRKTANHERCEVAEGAWMTAIPIMTMMTRTTPRTLPAPVCLIGFNAMNPSCLRRFMMKARRRVADWWSTSSSRRCEKAASYLRLSVRTMNAIDKDWTSWQPWTSRTPMRHRLLLGGELLPTRATAVVIRRGHHRRSLRSRGSIWRHVIYMHGSRRLRRRMENSNTATTSSNNNDSSVATSHGSHPPPPRRRRTTTGKTRE